MDDSLVAGNDTFKELTSSTLLKFESREREYPPTTFAGIQIHRF